MSEIRENCIVISRSAGLIFTGTNPITPRDAPVQLSVISCAHNEEANISNFLTACLGSKGSDFDLNEVVVVASGCTDRTEQIVAEFQRRTPKVKLVSEPVRAGKVTALVHGFELVTGDVIVVENADTVPSPDAFDKILACFRDPKVQLVGVRPVPVGEYRTPAHLIARMMWDLHDFISADSVKIGEAYGLRRETSLQLGNFEDDDGWLSILSRSGGITSHYARDAVIWTRAPETFRDLWSQRLRIARQAARLRRVTGGGPPTWDLTLLVRALRNYVRCEPRRIPLVAAGVVMESIARVVGWTYATMKRAPLSVWRPVQSTKRGIPFAPSIGLPDLPPSQTSDVSQRS